MPPALPLVLTNLCVDVLFVPYPNPVAFSPFENGLYVVSVTFVLSLHHIVSAITFS